MSTSTTKGRVKIQPATSQGSRSGVLRATRRLLAAGLYVAALVLVWQMIIQVFGLRSYLLPSPGGVQRAAYDNAALLATSAWVTTVEALAGFALAVVIGVGLAIMIVYSKPLRSFVLPSLVAVNATPKVAVAPILIIWLGLGMQSKIAMAFLLSFFPIVINSARGMAEVQSDLIDYFRLLRASPFQTFLKARLPNSLPAMFDGFKIALPIAMIGAVIGEFIASQEGIGRQIIVAYSGFRTELVFAAVMTIAVISTILFELLVLAERVLLRWRPKAERF